MTSAVSKLFNPFMASNFSTLLLLQPAANEMYNQPDTRFWQRFWGILVHSSWEMASSSVIYLGLRTATAFFKSHQRFSMGFKSGDCDGHCRIFQDFFCNQALVEFEVCLGSLSCCWKVHTHTHTHKLQVPHWQHDVFSKDFLKLQWIILPSTRYRFPLPEDANQPQSITESPLLNCRQRVFFQRHFSFLFL